MRCESSGAGGVRVGRRRYSVQHIVFEENSTRHFWQPCAVYSVAQWSGGGLTEHGSTVLTVDWDRPQGYNERQMDG